MRFSVRLADLAEPLQLVAGALDRKQRLPILSHLRCQVSEQSLLISAFDAEIEIAAVCPITNLDAGSELGFTIPGRKLLDICRYLEMEAEIEMLVKPPEVSLRCGRFRSQLVGLPVTDFPEVELDEPQAEVLLEAEQVRHLIEQVAFAMAQQDVRYFFNGMLLEAKNEMLVAVATNGQRLAVAEVASPGTKSFQAIIPRKSVSEMLKLLRGGDTATIYSSQSHLRLVNGSRRLTTTLIDAAYPDYRRAIPEQGKNVLQMDPKVLRSALTRISILANELYHNVQMSLSEGQLKLYAHNAQQEEAEEELGVNYSGEPLEIAFNVGYLTDVLTVLSGDTVEIKMGGSVDPMLITNPASEHARYVISPMVL